MEELPVCEECVVHSELLEKVQKERMPEEIVQQMAETFKVLGDPTRVKIIHALLKSELCVCDLAELLEMTQSAISHQLRLLRNMNLVKYRKEGRTVFYSLDDDHITQLFLQGLNHVYHD
ncbi:MAG: metalloregulator ArsR/SmtB family transcription factor [Halanaerobium sp.]|nr:metalloregulator ArsR/SmtB family transcription factor [Halanaerobium sp.]